MKQNQSTTEQILDVFLETIRKDLSTHDVIRILKIQKDEKAKHRVYVGMAYLVRKGHLVKTRKVSYDQYYSLKPKQESLNFEKPVEIQKPNLPKVVKPKLLKKKDRPKPAIQTIGPATLSAKEPVKEVPHPFIFTVEIMTDKVDRIREIMEEVKDLLTPSEDIRLAGKRVATDEVVEIRVVKFKR